MVYLFQQEVLMRSMFASVATAVITIVMGSPLPAQAELVVVDGQVRLRDVQVEVPKRGLNMQTVEARFGAPTARSGAVGSPPITRWDYADFSVYFEHSLVVHAVVRGI